MKFAFVIAAFLFGLVSLNAQAQQRGPEQKVPPLIAKQPERSDFFGEWLRYDGTYQLAVAEGEDGQVTATYGNPDPVNVESASFSETDEGLLLLTVVLRDEGYPGSTYRLEYNPSYQILAGAYLMGQTGQSNEVYFTPSGE